MSDRTVDVPIEQHVDIADIIDGDWVVNKHRPPTITMFTEASGKQYPVFDTCVSDAYGELCRIGTTYDEHYHEWISAVEYPDVADVEYYSTQEAAEAGHEELAKYWSRAPMTGIEDCIDTYKGQNETIHDGFDFRNGIRYAYVKNESGLFIVSRARLKEGAYEISVYAADSDREIGPMDESQPCLHREKHYTGYRADGRFYELEKYFGQEQVREPESQRIAYAMVSRGELSLRDVEVQTPKICMAAVMRFWEELQYVHDQTPEICLAAIRAEAQAVWYVKEPTPELWSEAVCTNWTMLQYVEHPSPETCMKAALIEPRAIRLIRDVTPEIMEALILEGRNDFLAELQRRGTEPINLAEAEEALRQINDELNREAWGDEWDSEWEPDLDPEWDATC